MNQFTCVLVFICAFFLSACSNENNKVENNNLENTTNETLSEQKIPKNFSKCYSGIINNQYAINILLNKDDSVLEGYSYYKGKIGGKELKGKIENDGSFVVREYVVSPTGKEEPTGSFVGKIINNKLIGTWKSKNILMPINFLEITDNSVAKLDVWHYQKCQKGVNNPQNEACLDLKYFLLKNNNNKNEEKINLTIVSELLSEQSLNNIRDFETIFKKSNEKYFNDFQNEFNEKLDIVHVTTLKVITNRQSIFAYKNFTSTLSGGVYTDFELTFTNINFKEGNIIHFSDLIAAKDTTEFRSIAKIYFDKQYEEIGGYKNAGIDFGESSHFYLPNNFCITEIGLYFSYDAYEIACCRYIPSFIVPYSAFQHLISKGSLLDIFVNN